VQLKNRINQKIRDLVKNSYKLICKINLEFSILACLSLIIVGQVINYWFPLKWFHLYQFLFLIALVYSSFQIKWFFKDFQNFKRENASHLKLHFLNMKLSNNIDSAFVALVIILITSMYVFASIWLKFIDQNLMGVYAILIIILVVALAAFAYSLYTNFLIYLDSISNEEELNYNYYYPAKTKWLMSIAAMGNRFSNGFFILGFIYTLVFFLNSTHNFKNFVKSGDSTIWTKLVSLFQSDLVFSISWITIFIIIIIAFPIFYLKQNRYYLKIIEKMKLKTIQTLIDNAEVVKKEDSYSFENEIKLFEIISKIDGSPKYPIKQNVTIPIVSTILSMMVHLLKISESIT